MSSPCFSIFILLLVAGSSLALTCAVGDTFNIKLKVEECKTEYCHVDSGSDGDEWDAYKQKTGFASCGGNDLCKKEGCSGAVLKNVNGKTTTHIQCCCKAKDWCKTIIDKQEKQKGAPATTAAPPTTTSTSTGDNYMDSFILSLLYFFAPALFIM